jgi:hypothetical protein
MFSPHFINFVVVPLTTSIKRFFGKKEFFQSDMNQAFLGPEFRPFYAYAITLNVFFISLFYFTGMPILLLFAFVTFLGNYFVEKYLFINYYSKCSYIGGQLNFVVQ